MGVKLGAIYNGGFDATKVDPQTEFKPIPAGKYLAAIDASEMKKTKDGDGTYLKLTFKILAGECKGRQVFCNLNLQNRSQQAVEIAKGQLSAICHAVDVLKLQDSQQLHGKPIEIRVTCTDPDAQGRIFNEIKGFSKDPRSNKATAPQQEPAPAPVTVPDDNENPGWGGLGDQ